MVEKYKGKLTKTQRELALYQYFTGGESLKEVACKYGVTSQALFKWVKKYKVKYPNIEDFVKEFEKLAQENIEQQASNI